MTSLLLKDSTNMTCVTSQPQADKVKAFDHANIIITNPHSVYLETRLKQHRSSDSQLIFHYHTKTSQRHPQRQPGPVGEQKRKT